MLIKNIVNAFYFFFEGIEKVLHQFILYQKILQMSVPTYFEFRICYCTGVSKQEYNGDLGKLLFDPFQEKLGAYVFDKTFSGIKFVIKPIDPLMLYISAKNRGSGF